MDWFRFPRDRKQPEAASHDLRGAPDRTSSQARGVKTSDLEPHGDRRPRTAAVNGRETDPALPVDPVVGGAHAHEGQRVSSQERADALQQHPRTASEANDAALARPRDVGRDLAIPVGAPETRMRYPDEQAVYEGGPRHDHYEPPSSRELREQDWERYCEARAQLDVDREALDLRWAALREAEAGFAAEVQASVRRPGPRQEDRIRRLESLLYQRDLELEELQKQMAQLNRARGSTTRGRPLGPSPTERALQEHCEALEARIGKLLAMRFEQGVDNALIHVSDGRVNHNQISEKFCMLRDQDFQPLVRMLIAKLPAHNRGATTRKHDQGHRLKSLLATALLEPLWRPANDVSDEELISLVRDEVMRQFGWELEGDVSPLRVLIQRVREFLLEMQQARPDGRLVTERPGTIFDRDQHEAALGHDEQGTVLFACFPGYAVDNHLFVRPQVLTGP